MSSRLSSAMLVQAGRGRSVVTAILCAVLVMVGAGIGLRNLAAGAADSTVTVGVIADAYTNATKPTTNRGAGNSLRVDGSPVMQSYVKFAVRDIVNPITRAELQLTAVTSTRGIVVSSTANAWDEQTLTFDTAPGTVAAVGQGSGVAAGEVVTIDVTDAVPDNGTYSFRISTTSTTQQGFGTKEGGAGARLVITTSDPSVTDTPTSTVTSTSTSTTTTTSPTSSTSAPSTTTSTTPAPQPVDPTSAKLPVRAAFYYPWFPEAWKQSGYNPFTWYNPSSGFYDGSAQATVQQHIADMQYGGMDAGIASWWGQGTRTDGRIRTLLDAAAPTTFRWSLYYEQEGTVDPSVDQIDSDLTYLASKYTSSDRYLRVEGKPVIFVYGDPGDGCGTADRWTRANRARFYVVLKVFTGYKNCVSQPDSWHQYAPAKVSDSQTGYSFSVSPGFWLRSDAQARLDRNPTEFTRAVMEMVASNAPFQLVTTFNEWGEGTSVESAREWGSFSGKGTYLDILHTILGTPTASTPTNDPVIAAAGDIACDPADGNFKSGAGTSSACKMKATSDLLGGIPNLAGVLTLGDNQYEQGQLANFGVSYHPTWGRFFDKTYPAVGNHENLTAGAAGYFQYFGIRAGDPSKGYYSYDIGQWHLIALNSSCSAAGGCSAGSPQEQWLRADLAAHQQRCTLAYWHEPRFSSGQHGNSTRYDAFWRALHAAGADVVLSSHDHDYERFDPQTPDAAPSPTGIRAWVVGTGGKNHYGFSTVAANSVVRNSDTYGVLQLTLHPTSYDWKFLAEPGASFQDSGSATCT